MKAEPNKELAKLAEKLWIVQSIKNLSFSQRAVASSM
jgi:hypothetical protein